MAILSTTLALMRQGLMEYLGEWVNGTTSASAAASAKTLADSVKLVEYQNDYFNTQWALLTSGTNSTNVRRVSDFVQSTGALSIIVAYTAAIAASVSYELLRYHPTMLIRMALNKALLEIYDKTYRSILNEDLITGNALPNSDEDWALSTVPNHWANSTVTTAKETTIKRYGRASLKVTGGASAGDNYISQVEWPPLLDLAGYSIDFEAWVYASDASHARLGIFDDDGTTWSDYHDGGSDWDLLKVTRTIKSATKTIGFRRTGNVNTKLAYYDLTRAMNGPVSELVLPAEFIQGDVKKVYIQQASGELSTNERACDDLGWVSQPLEQPKPRIRYDDRLGVWLLSFAQKPTAGKKIRLEGIEPQTKLTDDTDTVALSETHLALLYPYAAYVLFSSLGLEGKAAIHKRKYDTLAARVAMPAIPCSAIFPWGRW